MKVLIVDDRVDDRTVLRYMVEQHGHEAIEAEDGIDGLAKAAACAPDLIISDGLMPLMDGFQFLREVKRDSALRQIPFIFYTASYKGGQERRLAMSLGAVAYLIKPIDPTELWVTVKGFLQRDQIAQPALAALPEEDAIFLKRYGQVVATKLEEKVRELEQTLEERRRAEEALRESQNFVRTILDSVDEGFIVVNREYCIIAANQAFCTLMKLPEEQVKGRTCHENFFGSHAPGGEAGVEDCPVRHTLETGLSHMTMHILTDESGAKHYLEIKSYPIFDSAQRVTSVIETINDITEKRRLEEQLLQAQKLESIGQLAGGVAHDFNNMLAVILGRTQLAMLIVPPDQPLYANLQEIRKAAERSADLTRQLLAFARKQVITPRAIDLNEALKGMLQLLRRLIGENISLDWVPDSARVPVYLDPIQLDQILANLCVNARDAITSAGQIIIETQLAVLDENYCADHVDCKAGEYGLLTVSDNGRGMDQATLARIFEPFFTTKGVGRGTGLGLATVYGIVKQNGGFIHVDSAPGVGTTFKIYLPRHAVRVDRQRQNSLEEVPPLRGDETILLVEDEPSILSITRQMLENCGYRVLAAGMPDEALRIASDGTAKIELLITDVVMPGMNGLELMKRLSTKRPQLKCLYMSGYPANVIARQGILLEGVHFIQKPFSLEDLTAKVRSALSEESASPGSM